MGIIRCARRFDSTLHLKDNQAYNLILYGDAVNGEHAIMGVYLNQGNSVRKAWGRAGYGSWATDDDIYGFKILFDDSEVMSQYTQDDTTNIKLGKDTTQYDRALVFTPPCGGRINKVEFGFHDPGSANYPCAWWELRESGTVGSGILLAQGYGNFDGTTWQSIWGDKRLKLPFTLTTDMLSQSGLGSFSAAYTLSRDFGYAGFTVSDDTAGGEYLRIDFGSNQAPALKYWGFHTYTMSAFPEYGMVQYSDNGSTWYNALSSSMEINASTGFSFDIAQLNAVGPHRYWQYITESGFGFGDTINYNSLFVCDSLKDY